MRLLACSLMLAIAGCQTVPSVPKVQTVTVTKEIQRPCAVTVPVKPAPLARPLPTDSVALAALLGGKLLEWAGAGGYGDRADAALKVCTKG